jgi:adenosylmethionine-8-amino-7-oxononanoate aminotransferase
MIKRGVIARSINTDTNAFCPPFVITDQQIDKLLDVFAAAAQGK